MIKKLILEIFIMRKLIRNEIPIYEIMSGAAIAFAALLLIIPGFATDLFGLILIFPLTRKILMNAFSKKYSKGVKRKNFIEGEFEDMDDKKDE